MVENCQRLAPLPLAAKDIPDAPPVSQQHFPLEVERVEKTRAYVLPNIAFINSILLSI